MMWKFQPGFSRFSALRCFAAGSRAVQTSHGSACGACPDRVLCACAPLLIGQPTFLPVADAAFRDSPV